MQSSSQTAVFILRCWSEPQQGKPALWRYRLEAPQTNDYWYFNTPDALCTFLETQIDQRKEA